MQEKQVQSLGRGDPLEKEMATHSSRAFVALLGYFVITWLLCLVVSDSFLPVDCSPSGSSVLGILQARILPWIAISFSRGFSLPRAWTRISHLAGRFFTSEPPTSEAWLRGVCTCVQWLQSCPTLFNPMGVSPPGSSVHSPGKNTGVGCHALLQGIFSTQGSNCIYCVSCIAGGFFFLPLSRWGSPYVVQNSPKKKKRKAEHLRGTLLC